MELSVEQKKIIEMVVQGKTNQEIGLKLNYTEGNIKKKLHKIYKIFAVKKRAELVREILT